MNGLNLKTAGTALLLSAGLAFVASVSAQESYGSDKKEKMVSFEAINAPTGTYAIDKTHGYVTFSYSHFGLSNPQVRFRDVESSIEFNTDHPEKSQVSATLKAASVDTGVDVFDGHLNSENWFDTENHHKISFASTSFTRTSQTEGTMTGDLTIKGITKSVAFDVVLLGAQEHFRTKKPTLGLEGRATVLRSDFDLGAYAPSVSDEVAIVISAEYNKTE